LAGAKAAATVTSMATTRARRIEEAIAMMLQGQTPYRQ
jgi:hypothetical protein